MNLQSFKYFWHIAGWGLVTLIVYLSIEPIPVNLGVENSDKLSHLTAYFILMWWFAQVFPRSRYLLLALACIGLGGALEIIQGFTEGWFCEFADVLANSAGVFLAWWVAKLWSIFPVLTIPQETIHD